MLISYLSDSNLIKVTAPEITSFVSNIDTYTTVRVTANINCGTTPVVNEYDTTEVLDINNTDFYISIDDNALYIKATMYNLIAFVDGVYTIGIRFLKSSSATIIENCAFVDITYKCKVASLLDSIVAENTDGVNDEEKPSTIAHILHYALFNGSNCGCNCSEMCTVFIALSDILGTTDPQITNDCGC